MHAPVSAASNKGSFHPNILPAWASLGLFMEAAPIGYACIHAGYCQLHRPRRSHPLDLPSPSSPAAFPFYLFWSDPAHLIYSETLADLVLALQTTLTAWLLISTCDSETVWPRLAIASFASLYAAVEYARVAVFLLTGRTPNLAAPWVEIASGMVYVVSCSVMPLAIVWMMHERLHAHMDRQTTSDSLTQLLNRRGIQAAGQHELGRFSAGGQDFAIVLLDIDHFKRLNDTFGHAGGDTVLRETAALFQRILRDCDSIGRLGGEEFVLLLPRTSPQSASLLVERLRLTLQVHSFQLGDRKTRVTSSFGITSTQGRSHLTWDTLLQEADLALYAAKNAGRNRAESFRIKSPSPLRSPALQPA